MGEISPNVEFRRFLILIATGFFGIVVGSFISALLPYWHHPDLAHGDVYSNTIAAVMSSPFSMSLGVLPTIDFYKWHGWLVVPGALMATVGAIVYFAEGKAWLLIVILVGFILWSHNNFLSFEVMLGC